MPDIERRYSSEYREVTSPYVSRDRARSANANELPRIPCPNCCRMTPSIGRYCGYCGKSIKIYSRAQSGDDEKRQSKQSEERRKPNDYSTYDYSHNMETVNCDNPVSKSNNQLKTVDYSGNRNGKAIANKTYPFDERGNKSSSAQFCMYCGNKISAETTICYKCGCPVVLDRRNATLKRTDTKKSISKHNKNDLMRGEAFYKIPLISALICGIISLPYLIVFIDNYNMSAVSWEIDESYLEPIFYYLKRGFYESSYVGILLLLTAIVFLIVGLVRKSDKSLNHYGYDIQPDDYALVERRSQLGFIFGMFSMFISILGIPALILSLSGINKNNKQFNKKNKAGYILGFIAICWQVCIGLLLGTIVAYIFY